MKQLYVDTGAFVARAHAADQHHRAATAWWNRARDASLRLVSSEHVFDETVTLLSRRLSPTYAADWALIHLESKAIDWLFVTRKDFQEATRWFKKYSDHQFSFTNCVSFVLMKRLKIVGVFGFDTDFERAGFRLQPQSF